MATALEIVNRVQEKLRLPKSSTVTNSHGALILSFVNETQRDLLCDGMVWDELKAYGSFDTTPTDRHYTVTGAAGYEIDVIRCIQVMGLGQPKSGDGTGDGDSGATLPPNPTVETNTGGGYPPLVHCTDERFRKIKRLTTGPGRPLYYRHYARAGKDSIVIEVCPLPDEIYLVSTEALVRPRRLVAEGDLTILDDDLIVLGAFMLAKGEQGDDYQTALAEFQAKLGLISGSQGESNWGDAEAV